MEPSPPAGSGVIVVTCTVTEAHFLSLPVEDPCDYRIGNDIQMLQTNIALCQDFFAQESSGRQMLTV